MVRSLTTTKVRKIADFPNFFVYSCEIVWVRIWVNRLTHTLTHTLESDGQDEEGVMPEIN